jgi:quercetin dioxygenase-like cupin family protein
VACTQANAAAADHHGRRGDRPNLERAMANPANPFLDDVRPKALYQPAKMGKSTLFQGAAMMVGLNAFEPGQEHAPHAHAGVDKLYHVVEGRGDFSVGDVVKSVAAGSLVFAPAGIPHGVKNPGPARLLVLVVMSPPPA